MTRRARVGAAACLVLALASCGDDASERGAGAASARSFSASGRRDGEERPSAAPRGESDEARRLRQQFADLDRRVRELERRLGDAPSSADGRADDGVPRPRLYDPTVVDEAETERLRDRVLAGAASPEEARQFWDRLARRAGTDETDDAAPSAAADAKPRDRPRAFREDLWLTLDEADNRWKDVKLVADGARVGAASFAGADSRIDVGPCPISSREPFTLHAYLRTRDDGFSTALIARDGDAVGVALVMGRKPGHVSFEAWSWATARLISRHRVDDGAWHEIEVAYDPRTRGAILSVDNVRQDAAVLGSGEALAASLRLGDNIGGASQQFKGDLDEVGVTRKTAHPEAFGVGAAARK